MDFFQFDDEYLRRLREGDRETAEHYTEYFQLHLKMKLRGRIPPADINDIIQNVHACVFKALSDVRESRKFGAFVFGICDNVMHEYWRKQRPTEELTDTVVADIDVVRELITKERKERVHQTILAMEAENKRDGAILRAFFLKETDKDEICREWGVAQV